MWQALDAWIFGVGSCACPSLPSRSLDLDQGPTISHGKSINHLKQDEAPFSLVRRAYKLRLDEGS